jgi:hypothetical protein
LVLISCHQIRLKRLAKLQSQPSTSNPSTPPPSTSSLPPVNKPIPKPTPKRELHEAATPSPVRVHAPAQSRQLTPSKLDLDQWENATISMVLNVTLDVRLSLYHTANTTHYVSGTQRDKAESSSWNVVWLKELENELVAEDPCPFFLLPITVPIISNGRFYLQRSNAQFHCGLVS